jgi:hypothetical protein
MLLALTYSRSARATDELLVALRVGAHHELLPKLRAALSGELRLDDGLSRLERVMPQVAISYRLIKPVALAGGYRLAYARNEDRQFEVAQRVHADGNLSGSLFRLKLKYRLRVLDQFEARRSGGTKHKPTLRNSLALSPGRWPLRPFVSAEHFLSLDDLGNEPTRQWRLSAGVHLEQGPATYELYYRLDLPIASSDAARTHLLGVGVAIEL